MHSEAKSSLHPVLSVGFLFATLVTHTWRPIHAQVDTIFRDEENSQQDYSTISVASDDRYVIATHRNGIAAWDLSAGRQVYRLEREIEAVSFAREASNLFFLQDYGETLMKLNMEGPPSGWKPKVAMKNVQNLRVLSVSPDGQSLAAVSKSTHFGVLDLSKQRFRFQHKLESIERATFSPDGDEVAVAFSREENAVVTYSATTGTRLRETASFLASAATLAYSPDGETLAVGCRMGGESSVVLLNASKLRPIRNGQFKIDSSPRNCAIAWSHRAPYLAISGSYRSTKIFDVRSKKQLVELRGYRGTALALNDDGSRMASVCNDGNTPGVVWWDWQSNLRFQEPSRTAASHPRLDQYEDRSRVSLRLQYSPDGKTLALAVPCPDSTGMSGAPLRTTEEPGVRANFDFKLIDHEASYIFLLDPTSGTTQKAMFSKTPAFASGSHFIRGILFDNLNFSQDGKSLACLFRDSPSSSGHLVIWDISTARPRVRMLIKNKYNSWHVGWLDLKYVDGDRSLLLLSDGRDLGVQLFDLNKSVVSRSIRAEFSASLLKLPDSQFASGFATWDYASGDALYRDNNGNASDFHPLARTTGNTVVGLNDDRLGRWDLDTLKVSYPYAAHRGSYPLQVHSLASSPDGRLVATGCADRLIRIWDSSTGRLLTNLKGHRRAVDAVCFAPDGRTLASASRDGTTRFWDIGDLATQGTALTSPELPTHRTFRTAAGATVTVQFDRRVPEEEIRSALSDAQAQLAEG